VLERLTDDDIKQILTYAVDRVSPMEHGKMTSSEPSSSRSDPAPTPQSVHPSSPPASSPSLVQDSCPSFPQLTPRILAGIVSLSTGDARVALSLLDMVLRSSKDAQENTLLSSLRQSVSGSYDRTGDSHYDMISALHKSVRGSHGSAAMYWLARMLTAGEDPLYIARRMVVCASEDIGLADRHALPLVGLSRSP
jgi:putative ATPase